MTDQTTSLLADHASEAALAAQLKKSVRTVQRWRGQRIGPPVTWIGKTPYYHIPSAREWLRSRELRSVRRRGRRNT